MHDSKKVAEHIKSYLHGYADANEVNAEKFTEEVVNHLQGNVLTPTKKVLTSISKKTRGSSSSAYWAKLTPEQRTAEMKKRMKVRQKNAAAATRPIGGVA